ncbi:MAG: hypothetical protein NVSMB42_23790 [Herpetosiphon sp.]
MEGLDPELRATIGGSHAFTDELYAGGGNPHQPAVFPYRDTAGVTGR